MRPRGCRIRRWTAFTMRLKFAQDSNEKSHGYVFKVGEHVTHKVALRSSVGQEHCNGVCAQGQLDVPQIFLSHFGSRLFSSLFPVFPRKGVASCHARDGVRWKFQVCGCKSFVGHGPSQFGGRWHQVAVRRMSSSSRSPFGGRWRQPSVGPKMQRPHDGHQIQMRRWRLHGRKSPVWRRHWRPSCVIMDQKWTLFAVRRQKAKQAAQELPLKAQLVQTDAFIEQSHLRIQKLDQERRRSFSIRRCRDRHGCASGSPQSQFQLRIQCHPVLATNWRG